MAANSCLFTTHPSTVHLLSLDVFFFPSSFIAVVFFDLYGVFPQAVGGALGALCVAVYILSYRSSVAPCVLAA